MKEFNSLTNLVPGEMYSASGIILKVVKEGVQESRRPSVLLFQSEKNGVKFKVSSWDYNMIDTYKSVVESRNICDIEFKIKEYNDTLSYNMTSFSKTDKISELSVEEEQSAPQEVPNDFMKKEIADIISQVQHPIYRSLLDNLLLMYNDNFYVWPAAKTVHHSFVGGLVLHSYNVCSDALNIANQYNTMRGTVIDYDLLITGALLHDIGKLKELNQNGDYTHVGNLMSHIILGVEMINDACDQLNIDKYSEDILKLKHLILSHHGKLEFGSPNLPMFIEAYILNTADMEDAKIETLVETLSDMNSGEISQRIRWLDDGRVIKTY